jgi:predicted alpha/beta superfamily hydrolase
MKSLITLIYVTFCLFSFSQKTRNCSEIVTLESTFLNESRDIWIGLPTNYDSTKTYPTLYVLDAEWWFDITYALTKEFHDNQEKSPEMIVIGIPQIDRKHRMLDMTFTDSKNDATGHMDSRLTWKESETGGGLNLLNHIEKEIVSCIDSAYSTNGFNTMAGHSLGGYFCAYILPIQTKFSTLLIYDASIWYNSANALKHIRKNLTKNQKTNVYITSALEVDGPEEMIKNHIAKIDSLNLLLKTYPNINLAYKIYPNKQHVSMYMYSVMDGLTSIFDGYNYGFISLDDTVTLETYHAHYKKLSNRLGFEFTAPLDGIKRVAYVNFQQKKWQNTIDAYEACYIKYKYDITINRQMAICYKNLGDKKKSKYYFSEVKNLEAQ